MSILAYNASQSRQGGKCWDATTRQWRRCAGSASPGGGRGSPTFNGPPGGRCCQLEDCCLQCNDFTDLMSCIVQNAAGVFEAAYAAWEAVQIIRRNGGGPCDRWRFSGIGYGVSLIKNGETLSCFRVSEGVNSYYTPSDGEVFLTSITLESLDPNCVDVGLFFLVKAQQLPSAEFEFGLIKTGVCVAPQAILTPEMFDSECVPCTSALACQARVGAENPATGGYVFGYAPTINLGDLPVGASISLNAVMYIPICCENSEISYAVDNSCFLSVDLDPSSFSPPGVLFFTINLSDASAPGNCSVVITFTIGDCGSPTLTIKSQISA